MHTLPVRREFSCGDYAETTEFSTECAGEGEKRNGSTPSLQATSDVKCFKKINFNLKNKIHLCIQRHGVKYGVKIWSQNMESGYHFPLFLRVKQTLLYED